MSSGYQIDNQQGSYYVTLQTIDWVDVFTRAIYKDIIIESLKYCINNKGLVVYAYVIMSNHLHLIIKADEGYELSAILRDFKKFTANQILQTISKIEREIGVPKLDLALIMADFFNVTLEYLFCLSDKKHKLEHQIEIDKTIEEFYDFFVDYQDLNSENKETLNLIMRRLLEVQANEEAE